MHCDSGSIHRTCLLVHTAGVSSLLDHGKAGGAEGPGGLPQRPHQGAGVPAAAAHGPAEDDRGETDGDRHRVKTRHQPGG